MTIFGWSCLTLSLVLLIQVKLKAKNLVSPFQNEVHMAKRDIGLSIFVSLAFIFAYLPRNILIYSSNLDLFQTFPYSLVYSLSSISCPLVYSSVCTLLFVLKAPHYNQIVKRLMREAISLWIPTNNQITVLEWITKYITFNVSYQLAKVDAHGH